jgi:hypothetical protein
MTDYHQTLTLHLSTLDDPPAAAQALGPIAHELDARMQHLDGEPDTPNTRLARVDAKREAAEKIDKLVDGAESQFGGPIQKAHSELMRPPEPDRFMVQRYWSSLPPDFDSVMIAAVWSTLSEFERDSLLVHPPRVVKQGDGFRSVALIDPELRDREMRARRPEAAAKYDRLVGQREAVRLAAGWLRGRIAPSARDELLTSS